MRRLLVGAVSGLLVATALFVSDAPVRRAVKDRLIAIDNTFLNAGLRRVYYRQRMPRLDAPAPPSAEHAYSWIEEERFLAIAHRLGPVLQGGPNTLVTFQAGLRMGFTVFEVDLVLSRDEHLICYPDGSDEDEAIDELVYSTYVTTMRERGVDTCHFSDLVKLARENPHVRFILDVKNGPDEFERVYRTIRREIEDPEVGLSFIPQIYDFEQLEGFRAAPFFAGEIFTAYRSVLTTTQIVQAARHFDIRAVTVPVKRFNEWRGALPGDLFVLTHPVNDPFEAARIRERGGRGIYTGYLTPSTVPELFGG